MVQTLAAKAQNWPPDERTAGRVDAEVKSLYLKDRIELNTHLKFIQDYLVKSPLARKSLSTYARVLSEKHVPDDPTSPVVAHLKLAGVVRSEAGKLHSRNRIYRTVFNREWVRENRPSDALRMSLIVIAMLVVFGILWPQVFRPGLFPRFPEIQSELYTPGSSRLLEFSVAGSEVRRAYLTDLTEVERELVIPENQLVQDALASLKQGQNRFWLRLVGGWFSEERKIPLTVTYYPNWEIRQLPASQHSASAQAIAFSPDGKTVASASLDHTLKLWDIATGHAIRTFVDHTAAVYDVAFSPDGTILASSGGNGTIILWWAVRQPRLSEALDATDASQ